MEAVGNCGEGGDEDGGNGAVTGYAVQGSSLVGVVIWERELGGDGGHDKTTTWIPSSGNYKD